MGIGPTRDVGLAKARKKATEARQLLRDGVDPIEHRNAQKAERRKANENAFRLIAARYIEEQTPGWRDAKLPARWTSSLERLAYPAIGDLAVATITAEDVLEVLRPIWPTLNHTADRVRGRIERILEYATSRGLRGGDNPARWRGHLEHMLPKPSTVTEVEHHAAVPWKAIGGVMAELTQSGSAGALAVRFVCLTAVRSGEARGAQWEEIDLEEKVWTVPAERMKGARRGRRAHRVPLSAAALDVLMVAAERHGRAGLVFPGGAAGKPLTDVALSKALHAAASKEVTVHGFRSTFRDWAAEDTDYPRDVAEMALAHAIGSKVEATYRRGDLFEKRQGLMEDWGTFCAPDTI